MFVSRPGFDPNPFVVGIANDAYQALQSSENQPLYNRALRGLYPPGSTVKPFIALAGLEYEAVSPQQNLSCHGYYQLPGVSHQYRDWKKGGHGSVNMNKAITESCDVYFYRLAATLGIDHMHSFLQKFGFGEKSGIDLVGGKSRAIALARMEARPKKSGMVPRGNPDYGYRSGLSSGNSITTGQGYRNLGE